MQQCHAVRLVVVVVIQIDFFSSFLLVSVAFLWKLRVATATERMRKHGVEGTIMTSKHFLHLSTAIETALKVPLHPVANSGLRGTVEFIPTHSPSKNWVAMQLTGSKAIYLFVCRFVSNAWRPPLVVRHCLPRSLAAYFSFPVVPWTNKTSKWQMKI